MKTPYKLSFKKPVTAIRLCAVLVMSLLLNKTFSQNLIGEKTGGLKYLTETGLSIQHNFLNKDALKKHCENKRGVNFKRRTAVRDTKIGVSELKKTAITDTTPAIIMTTALPADTVFTFLLGTFESDSIKIQVDFGDSVKKDFIIGSSDSIKGIVGSSKIIKVYGSGIVYLDCNSNKITNLDVTKDTFLTQLHSDFNELTSIDLTKNIHLEYLSCGFNKLTSLELSYNSDLESLICWFNQISSLNLSSNLKLRELSCYHNQLTQIDVSKDTLLQTLDCSHNLLSHIDVCKNIHLWDLGCSHNLLTSIDVSSNTELQSFVCANNKIENLDVSKNMYLEDLYCGHNLLTGIDLSKNWALQFFLCDSNSISNLDLAHNLRLEVIYCNGNLLSSLDVLNKDWLVYLDCSSNLLADIKIDSSRVIQLNCSNNHFFFGSLPLPITQWPEYIYAPQKPVVIAGKTSKGTEIDLSSQFLVNSDTTHYVWKTKTGTILTEGADYTIFGGKTVFAKSFADSIYCEMTNAAFPDFKDINVLKTTFTKVSDSDGLNEAKIKQILIYTNRETVYLTVPISANAAVYDITGREVATALLNTGLNALEMKAPGIYIVNINFSDGATVTKKIIVN